MKVQILVTNYKVLKLKGQFDIFSFDLREQYTGADFDLALLVFFVGKARINYF